MHEIQKMNLLPVKWILSILQNHYYSVSITHLYFTKYFQLGLEIDNFLFLFTVTKWR